MEKINKEEILNDVVQKFDLYKGQQINYNTFSSIYEEYMEVLSEVEFANLLGINNREYNTLRKKANENRKAFILTNNNVDEQEQQEILKELIKEYDLYKGKQIDFDLFMKMYENVKISMTQTEFAELLGIRKKTYEAFKLKAKSDNTAKVIISLDLKITEEDKKIVIKNLINENKLQKGQKIDYSLFRKLYDGVKIYYTENEFANILGIGNSNLRIIRKEGTARIFKNMVLEKETIEKVRKNIMQEYEGKRIFYNKDNKNNGDVSFIKLYNPYSLYFTENEFAGLLGISEKNLWYATRKRANPIIKDIEKVKRVEELKKLITEGKYYTKEEIEEMCKSIDISIVDFINYYINKGKFFDYTTYEQAIEKNNGLYIGRGIIQNKDLEKYSEMFDRIVKTVVNNINSKYREYYLEDELKSDMLIYIVYNCSDLVKNFEYDLVLMERMIWLRARKYTQINYIQNFIKDTKNVIRSDDEYYRGQPLVEVNYDDIDIDEEKISKEERITNIFNYYLRQGYEKETILENMSQMFKIDEKEILDIIRNYLLSNRKVVENKNGEYEIGE